MFNKSCKKKFVPIYQVKYRGATYTQINTIVGHDNTPAFFLQIASSVIILHLQVFIEFCLTKGVFPESCMIARIVPIFKNRECEKPTNYHPISILTCFSKIFDGLIYKCVNIFLNKHNVFINTQYAF